LKRWATLDKTCKSGNACTLFSACTHIFSKAIFVSVENKGAKIQQVEIPRQSWFQFDAEQGTEKLWLIFSGKEVPELEAVKQFANPKDQGLIKDTGLQARVEEFLAGNSAAKPMVEKNDELKETSLKIAAPIMVHLIRLEHH